MKFIYLILIYLILPQVVWARDLGDILVNKVGDLLENLIVLLFVIFVFGLIFTTAKGVISDKSDKKETWTVLIWGLFILAILTSVWVLAKIIQRSIFF